MLVSKGQTLLSPYKLHHYIQCMYHIIIMCMFVLLNVYVHMNIVPAIARSGHYISSEYGVAIGCEPTDMGGAGN